MLYFHNQTFNSYLVAKHFDRCGFTTVDYAHLRQFIDCANDVSITLLELTGSLLYKMLNDDFSLKIDNVDFVYYGAVKELDQLLRFFPDEMKQIEFDKLVYPDFIQLYQITLEQFVINIHCLPLSSMYAKRKADMIAASVLKYTTGKSLFECTNKENFLIMYSEILHTV